jgi:hypothetical protein
MAGEDPVVDLLLDVVQLLASSGCPCVKSKRSFVRTDVGAGLAHVRADPVAQRGVQQVRRGCGCRRSGAGAPDRRGR